MQDLLFAGGQVRRLVLITQRRRGERRGDLHCLLLVSWGAGRICALGRPLDSRLKEGDFNIFKK